MRSDRVKRLLSATVGAATAASVTGATAWCVSDDVTLLRLSLWTLWVCTSVAVFLNVLVYTYPRGADQYRQNHQMPTHPKENRPNQHQE